MTKRKIRVNGDVAYVPLTQGYEAVIDSADAHLVEAFDWYVMTHPSKRSVYACRKIMIGEKRTTERMHRTIMGNPESLDVDHIDGNGLNNRRNNLRLATTAQNAHNACTRTDNSSGFKGVSWHKKTKKWQARIALNGERKSLGYFCSPEQAYSAYCRASLEYHGEFGRVR